MRKGGGLAHWGDGGEKEENVKATGKRAFSCLSATLDGQRAVLPVRTSPGLFFFEKRFRDVPDRILHFGFCSFFFKFILTAQSENKELDRHQFVIPHLFSD